MNQPGPSRQIGRVRTFVMVAPMLDAAEDPSVGSDLVVRHELRDDGCLALWYGDRSGEPLATYLIAGDAHLDVHYGRYSMSSPAYCYGSQLEVAPAARGRGLGVQVVRIGRAAAAEHFGRGIYGLVERSNAASVRCNLRAGFVATTRLDGVRVGGKVHWLPGRPVRP
ncbi:MAG: hypothetical protein JWM47_1013 [Acidimicrobiales bacterium]|nr:hypothetical protein [Acidimicrobiales bacterium]